MLACLLINYITLNICYEIKSKIDIIYATMEEECGLNKHIECKNLNKSG